MTDAEREEALEDILRFAAAPPEIRVLVSKREAERYAAIVSDGCGELTHAEVLGLIVPIVETLFDDAVTNLGIPFHAELAAMLAFPAVPESLVLQVAFGRRIGEQQYVKFARLANRAERRGLTVDEYIADLAEADAVPRDLLVRLFRGESRRVPSKARMSRAVGILRRTAALAPEPLRAPILSAIGWLMWAKGSRATSLAYVEDAVRIDPESPLAGGLRVHFAQTVPDWLGNSDV